MEGLPLATPPPRCVASWMQPWAFQGAQAGRKQCSTTPPFAAALSQGLGQPLGVKRLGILPCSCVVLHNVLLLALTLPSPSIQPPLVCSFPTAGA